MANTTINLIDEAFRPPKKIGEHLLDSDSELLPNVVAEEMRAEGLDPLNKNDIQKYWKSRGINLNG